MLHGPSPSLWRTDHGTWIIGDFERMKQHDAYAVWRLPAFRRYFTGNMILILGWQMQKVAIGWEIYERTHSAMALGYAGLAQFFPQVLFMLIAGHVTDQHNRKRVLMSALACNALAAFGLAVNAAVGGSIYVLYACLFAYGSARAFIMPSRAAFLPGIIPMEIFSTAVSWNSSGFEISSMAGPAIGGLLIGFFQSPTLVYSINAVGQLTFVVLLAGLTYKYSAIPRQPMTLHSFSAGLRFVSKQKVVLSAMALDMFGVLLGGATAMMPIYAKDILKVGPRGLGWLMTAPSIGAFTMALFQAHRGPMRKAGRTLLFAVAGFGIVTVVFGISRNFWLSMMMLAFLGLCDNISVVVRSTLVQILTPDEMRGRVSALNSLFIGTSNELGAFESGLVANFFGPVISVVSGGIGTLLIVLGMTWLSPQLRSYGRLDEVRQ
jgi:MFS family permease